MDREDLNKIKRDLEEGNIRRLVNKRLNELDDDNKVCPVCSTKVTSDDYVLEFGEVGLRMKATFDELDCLQHFIKKRRSSDSSSS